MTIASDAFQDNEYLPAKYARSGEDINPPLTFSEVPAEAASLALIMDDPDAPGRTFTHWVVYSMPPATIQILEGSLPMNACEGQNDYGEKSYGGPAPPSGTHRYVFSLYALDADISQDENMTTDKLRQAMDGHILETAKITGLFSANAASITTS
jgi:Raf kinase inhibitor-like YbhB/YbcL family protein